MMGVLTFSANRDQVEGRVLVRGNSSMASNSASAPGNVEYVDNVAPDLASVGLAGLRDLLWLRNAEFENQARLVEHFPSLQQLAFISVPPHF